MLVRVSGCNQNLGSHEDARLINTLNVIVPKWLTIASAEEVVTSLAQDVLPSRVVVDFSECQAVDAGAGFRLANAFARFRTSNFSSLEVILPTNEQKSHFYGRRWFQVFVRSGIGASLATYATTVYAGLADVTGQFATYFQRITEGYTTASPNNVVVSGLRGSHVNVVSLEMFHEVHLRSALRKCHYSEDDVSKGDIYDAGAICFEAVRNVLEHSNKPPGEAMLDVLSYLGIRYFKSISPAAHDSFGFRDYLISREKKSSGLGVSYLELTVNDDGVGIPARFAGSTSVYRASIIDEVDVLQAALTSGQSAKNQRASGNTGLGTGGFGYTQIIESLVRLEAYAVLRTGRCCLVLDGAAGDGSFSVDSKPYGFMPGTTLHVVVPIRPKQIQLRLPLGRQ